MKKLWKKNTRNNLMYVKTTYLDRKNCEKER